jgi:two-component system, LuxR family, response regulator FixJ
MAESATIFIVDDDDAVRESLQLLLESNGYKIAPFVSGTAFLAAVPKAPSGCLLVDVRMPGLSGIEVEEELARRGIALPTIVLTGHADVPLAVRAMQAGATDFIEKPYDAAAILASVERALRLGRAARQADAQAAIVRERAERLTARERDVLGELVAGHANKVIAHHLDISPRTVEIHRSRVMEKMEAKSLSELVRMALAAGLAAEQEGSLR